MTLMDDAMFKLWKDGKVTVEDVLSKAQNPDDLARRIVQAKREMQAEAKAAEGQA
jgi:twitching motility protein PilT